MWTVRLYRLDGRNMAVGRQDKTYDTKREALWFLATIGIKTDQKRITDNPASLISRVGHTYNVAVKN